MKSRRTCYRLAENLKGKLLLIHGTGDRAVLLGHTMRKIDALIKADKQFDLLLMPGETQSTFNMWMGYGLDAELRCFEEYLRVIRNFNDEQKEIFGGY